jgi:predicted nuclease with TOPRIM domain
MHHDAGSATHQSKRIQERMTSPMQERMRERLQELRQEWNSGNQQLAQVEAEHLRIREILLRIAGAIQVLEEELSSLDADQPSPE